MNKKEKNFSNKNLLKNYIAFKKNLPNQLKLISALYQETSSIREHSKKINNYVKVETCFLLRTTKAHMGGQLSSISICGHYMQIPLAFSICQSVEEGCILLHDFHINWHVYLPLGVTRMLFIK